jgi:hypothetical protein
MLKQVAFVVLVFAGALVAAIALYWLVTEIRSFADFIACYIELLLGGACIAPAPDILP